MENYLAEFSRINRQIIKRTSYKNKQLRTASVLNYSHTVWVFDCLWISIFQKRKNFRGNEQLINHPSTSKPTIFVSISLKICGFPQALRIWFETGASYRCSRRTAALRRPPLSGLNYASLKFSSEKWEKLKLKMSIVYNLQTDLKHFFF